jgi:hypothetical protein
MVDETIEYPSGDGDGPYYQGAGGNAPPDGNFVVAETGAGTKLMEWDATAGEWVVRGPVEMSGNDVTGVGALDADSVNTEKVSFTSDIRGKWLIETRDPQSTTSLSFDFGTQLDRDIIVIRFSRLTNRTSGESVQITSSDAGSGDYAQKLVNASSTTGLNQISVLDNPTNNFVGVSGDLILSGAPDATNVWFDGSMRFGRLVPDNTLLDLGSISSQISGITLQTTGGELTLSDASVYRIGEV